MFPAGHEAAGLPCARQPRHPHIRVELVEEDFLRDLERAEVEAFRRRVADRPGPPSPGARVAAMLRDVEDVVATAALARNWLLTAPQGLLPVTWFTGAIWCQRKRAIEHVREEHDVGFGDTRSDALTDTGSDDTPSDMGDCRWETETSDSLSVSEGAGINIVDEFCEPSPVQASNEAMRRGVEIHAALERAVVGPVADPIVVASAEDFVALRLLDARQRLCRLSDAEPATAEVFLAGEVHGVWFQGIVDRVEVARGASGEAFLLLVDYKTRSRDTPLGQEAMRTAWMQVRLYHALLAQTQARPREWAARLCGHLQARGLDVSSPLALTPAHRATLAAMGFPPTLRAAAVAYAQLVRSLPPLSSTLAGRVCYLSQADCRILHDMDVHISQDTEPFFHETMAETLAFYRGEVPPSPAQAAYQCRACQFQELCSVGRQRRGRAAREGMGEDRGAFEGPHRA